MLRLSVNIDHVATVRQARRGHEPDPVAAAVLAILGGADGITLHLREDRRHVQDRDVFRMRESITARINLEMATAPDILTIAEQVRPDEATLVPEKRAELTTEGGLDVVAQAGPVRAATDRLKAAGIVVSLFIDPDFTQIDQAVKLGADAVEFQTASYSEARTPAALRHEAEKLHRAATHAASAGLHVHAGHGLNYHNVQALLTMEKLEELNIGHSIVSRAVLVGMTQAVRDMKGAMARRPDGGA